MSCVIRYKIRKDGILKIRVPNEMKVSQIIAEVCKLHSRDFKYIYLKKHKCFLNEDEVISDYLPDGENTLFYFTDKEEINLSDFENVDEESENEIDTIESGSTIEIGFTTEVGSTIGGDSAKIDGTPSIESTGSFIDSDDNDLNSIDSGQYSLTLDNEKPLDDLLKTQLTHTIKVILRENHRNEADTPFNFFIYSTQNYERMINPIKINLSLEYNYAKTEQKIRETLDIDPSLQAHIFLSTGVPFFKEYGVDKENVLGNFYSNVKTNHNIYVIITKPIQQCDLDNIYNEVCNCSNKTMKCLISPIYKSTGIGYSRMSCLLGSFFYKGIRTNDFIKSVARCTGFAPLISCLSSMYNRKPINGLMIATISASLHALFSKLLPDTIKPKNVFDYCLECACYIVHIEETYIKNQVSAGERKLDQFRDEMIDIDNDPQEGLVKYLKECRMHGTFHPYAPDIFYEDKLNIAIIEKVPSFKEIEDIFNNYASFHPIPPLKVRNINMTCIMQYLQGHTVLFVGAYSDDDEPNYVNIIRPSVGEIETVDIEIIAKEVFEHEESDISHLIDSKDVEELIVILLDVTTSMRSRIKDGVILSDKTYADKSMVAEISRISVANLNIGTFLDKSFGYRLPHLFSLISFGSQVQNLCDFTPISPLLAYELSKIVVKLHSKSAIWDALDDAFDQLLDFYDKDKFPNAKLRVIVFSDGLDRGSKKKKEDVCIRAVQNKITVDSIILTLSENCEKLAKFSHLTGGYSFKSNDPNYINSLFEKESFLSLKLRPYKPPYEAGKIIKVFNSKEKVNYDEDILNSEFVSQSCITRISTPNYVLSRVKRSTASLQRYNLRLLKEMKIFQIKNNPNVRLFIKSSDIKTWKVFFEGPKESKYKNVWWYIAITFTDDYPLHPPLFRFITIPYHINVSEDGRVCASFLFSHYKSSFSIYDLIIKIRDLFTNPETDYPIQNYKTMIYKYDMDEFLSNVKKSKLEAYKDYKSCVENMQILDEPSFVVDPDDFEDKEKEEVILNISGLDLSGSIRAEKDKSKGFGHKKSSSDDDDDDIKKKKKQSSKKPRTSKVSSSDNDDDDGDKKQPVSTESSSEDDDGKKKKKRTDKKPHTSKESSSDDF